MHRVFSLGKAREMRERVVKKLEAVGATEALGEALGRIVRGGDVVVVSGELGAGKTALVRGMARGVKVAEGEVSSPTFVMVSEHGCEFADGARGRLVHVDAYRMGGVEDLEGVGWDRVAREDGRARGDVVLVVEWGERIAGALPAGGEIARVRLTVTGEEGREAEVEIPASWRGRPGVSEVVEREVVRCRVSGRWVSPTSATYPFADEKARMADLGRWVLGSYVVSREVTPGES